MKYLAGLGDKVTKQTVSVANADDEEVLQAIKLACRQNLCGFRLYGEVKKIRGMAVKINFHLDSAQVVLVETKSSQEAAARAVLSVQTGHAQVLMKGNVLTKVFLEAILDKKSGLRTGNLLSHTALFEIPGYQKPLFLTDAAINVAPVLEEKIDIINNAVAIAHRLGIPMPKVASLAAIEMINPAMQATVDGAILTQMQKRGQIRGCLIDGPLSFDAAVSPQATKQKNVQSEVAGQADILLAPNLEVGNALYKSFVHFAKAEVASIVAGAAAPIVLPSRSDTAVNKLHSLALALLSAN